MTSLFSSRKSTDSQRPQSRRSLKSRLSFSGTSQSRENIPEAILSLKDHEVVPPVPPLPRQSESETRETIVEVPEPSKEPLVSPKILQEEMSKSRQSVEASQPPKLTRTPTNPPPPPPKKSSQRHSRHDSAMVPSKEVPKRSSSFRSVLNTYYKIFGGSPKKPPKHEKLPEEAERLRKLTKKYEAQLEEASNILLLQDKVIARWEKDAEKRGTKVKKVGQEELEGFRDVRNEGSNGAPVVVPVEGTPDAQSAAESSRSLGLIRESSREMLSEVAAQQDAPTIRAIEPEVERIGGLEITKRDLAAAVAAREKLESDLLAARVELETVKKAQEEAVSGRSIEPVVVDTSIFDAERSTLQSKIDELQGQIHRAQVSHEEQKISLARELEDVKSRHNATVADHETTKASLSEQLAVIAGHGAIISKQDEDHAAIVKQKDDDFASLFQSNQHAATNHEKALAEAVSQHESTSMKLQALTADHEALNAKHVEALAAIETAKAQSSELASAQSGEHQEALAALMKQLEDAKAQLEESKAVAEKLKKEHADAIGALNLQIDDHKSLHEKALEQSKGHEDRGFVLDEELKSKKAAHRELEDSHFALKAERDGLADEKTSLEAKVAALTTASSGHEEQIAELGKVNKELAELKQQLDGHVTTKAELEAKIAGLEEDAGKHATTQSDLEVSRARVLELEDATAGHATSKADLEAKIAALEADVSTHATSKTDLEAKIAALEADTAAQGTTDSDLEASRARVIELEKAASGHATSKADLEAKIAALEADAAAHGTLKTDLDAKIIALEADVAGHATTLSDLETSRARILELEEATSAHATSKSELEAKIAALEADAGTHGTSQAELQDKIATLEKAADDHNFAKEELEAKIAALTADGEKNTTTAADLETSRALVAEHEGKIAALHADAEKHSAVLADLETSRARVAELDAEVEKHAATKARLENTQASIAELQAISDAHNALQLEHEDAKTKIESLSKDIDAHEAVKTDLSTAQSQIAELEKSVESGKADHATVAEKLAAVEASLATAIADHEKLTANLSDKETALSKALADVEAHQAELSEKSAALDSAQEALTKAQAEASSTEVLTKDLKSAEDKANAVEAQLASSNEKHEAEKAALSDKIEEMSKLHEQNYLLTRQLEVAQEGEEKAKIAVAKLEADLEAARDVHPVAVQKDENEEKPSVLGKVALAAGGVVAAGAGALGLAKLTDDGDDKAKESTATDEQESAARELEASKSDTPIDSEQVKVATNDERSVVAPVHEEALHEAVDAPKDAGPELISPDGAPVAGLTIERAIAPDSVDVPANAVEAEDVKSEPESETLKVEPVKAAKDEPESAAVEMTPINAYPESAIEAKAVDVLPIVDEADAEPTGGLPIPGVNAVDEAKAEPVADSHPTEESLAQTSAIEESSPIIEAGVKDPAASSTVLHDEMEPVKAVVADEPDVDGQGIDEIKSSHLETEEAAIAESTLASQPAEKLAATPESLEEPDLISQPSAGVSSEETMISAKPEVALDKGVAGDAALATNISEGDASKTNAEIDASTVVVPVSDDESAVEHALAGALVEDERNIEKPEISTLAPVERAPNDDHATGAAAAISGAATDEETPKIACLNCGNDVEADNLGEHFCTPVTTPEIDAELSKALDAEEEREAAELDAKTVEVSSPRPVADDIVEPKSGETRDSEVAGSAADVNAEHVEPVEFTKEPASIGDRDNDASEPISDVTEATGPTIMTTGPVVAETGPSEPAALADVSVNDFEEMKAAESEKPELLSDAVEKGDASATTITPISEEGAVEESTGKSDESPPMESTSTAIQSPAKDAEGATDIAHDVVASEANDLQGSPTTPQTPSKKKSVRWDDIESSKQSTPVEELEKQLDAPVVNGDHANSSADKHSIGPGSPVAEIHGLAIADLPLSDEPESTSDELQEAPIPESVPSAHQPVEAIDPTLRVAAKSADDKNDSSAAPESVKGNDLAGSPDSLIDGALQEEAKNVVSEPEVTSMDSGSLPELPQVTGVGSLTDDAILKDANEKMAEPVRKLAETANAEGAMIQHEITMPTTDEAVEEESTPSNLGEEALAVANSSEPSLLPEQPESTLDGASTSKEASVDDASVEAADDNELVSPSTPTTPTTPTKKNKKKGKKGKK